jgi:hypothetical protein
VVHTAVVKTPLPPPPTVPEKPCVGYPTPPDGRQLFVAGSNPAEPECPICAETLGVPPEPHDSGGPLKLHVFVEPASKPCTPPPACNSTVLLLSVNWLAEPSNSPAPPPPTVTAYIFPGVTTMTLRAYAPAPPPWPALPHKMLPPHCPPPPPPPHSSTITRVTPVGAVHVPLEVKSCVPFRIPVPGRPVAPVGPCAPC